MGFSERFPRWTSGLIGIIQLAFTVAIIGLEVGSSIIDLAHGTIWVGYWAGLVFLKTVLMMFFITCCCRGRCCGAYVLLWNVLSGLLACVIIYFDRIFIDNLCKCYLGSTLCCAIGSVDSFRHNYTSTLEACESYLMNGNIGDYACQKTPWDKLHLLQAQLGCAVGMLISCAVYVVVYLFACFGICFGHN